MKKDYSISFVRAIAMCMILACHMLQNDYVSITVFGAVIEPAYWLNVGTQVFLFISGFLYGKRKSVDTLSFYKKGFPKILVDYYILVVILLICIHFSPLWEVPPGGVTGLLTISSSISGLGHLWYIRTVLFCYLFTPVFSKVLGAINQRKNVRFGVEAFLFLLLVHMVVLWQFYAWHAFEPSYIVCYLLGMIYGKAEDRPGKLFRGYQILLVILGVVMVAIRMKVDYWSQIDYTWMFHGQYEQFCNYAHVFLGITLFIVLRFLYRKCCIKKERKHRLWDWTDKYSFDIYLVHHVFIQSNFACVCFISSRWIALPLAILLTAIGAIVLHMFSEGTRRGLGALSARVLR